MVCSAIATFVLGTNNQEEIAMSMSELQKQTNANIQA